jgi:transposase
MTRTGEPSIAELMAQLAANAAEIAVLKAEKEALSQRVVKLEEELALAKLHRFAPRSEKHIDRLFNEAEETTIEDDGEEGDVVELPDWLACGGGRYGQKAGTQASAGRPAARAC